MAEHDAAVLDERDGHRRPHARGLAILVCPPEDPPVRLLDQLSHALLAAHPVGAGLPERGGGEPRGDLAGLRAAHPIGDREHRRLDDVGVLVVAPLAPRMCGEPDVHASNLRSVSPTRITSPETSFLGPSSFIPFTKVPFVEPTSSTQTPSRRGSTRAWCADANSSSPSSMSFSEERPSVTGAESSVRSLSTFSAGLERTTRLPVRARGPRPAAAACCGASTKLSCGSRTSRATVRTIRQMKR